MVYLILPTTSLVASDLRHAHLRWIPCMAPSALYDGGYRECSLQRLIGTIPCRAAPGVGQVATRSRLVTGYARPMRGAKIGLRSPR
jgi:hypothetical protein